MFNSLFSWQILEYADNELMFQSCMMKKQIGNFRVGAEVDLIVVNIKHGWIQFNRNIPDSTEVEDIGAYKLDTVVGESILVWA